ncbi:uncharacterized protein LOC131220315 [Magnolia sinica]|uniref:uncharacterized protein LOC131220315 n=1 Tax=Magnolia sinica TaxID=86752 RepID=UPI00265A6BD1|nr:uncharacterized protein LOC131220315 [Magnolia sinica]
MGKRRASSNPLEDSAKGTLYHPGYSYSPLKPSPEISSNWSIEVDTICLSFRGYPPISHLLFADDTLLFVNGSWESLLQVKSFLSSFQEVFGQKINYNKSCFLCPTKMSTSRIRNVKRILGFSKARSDILYLGVPLVKGRIKSAMFQLLMDKISYRINGWNSRFLSQAGRLTLIKHVLGSMSLHIMAAMKIPAQIVASLEHRFAHFF